MLRFLPLPYQFVVLPESERFLPLSLEQEVERIWKTAQARRGTQLFNGPLFSVDQIAADTVTGHFVEYRLFLAQMRRPELFSELRVQPLAVTGLLGNADGLFFGYRSPGVAQQPDCWELIPAGGIDRSTLTESGHILPVQQLLAELQEEVGLEPADISWRRLISFCEDPDHHIFDLVWELQSTLNTASICRLHAALARTEHTKITCVFWKDLNRFLVDDSSSLLVSNRDLLTHLARRKDGLIRFGKTQ